ncbi:MAG: AGE family epimerase/isomerase [Verrucomicrobia bacterium]|nr:AGE family epimerase/isomerase [Verrucomicrobiota bacterium]
MTTDFFREKARFYSAQLTDNILPFWIRHARDPKGGYHTCLNRDGSVYDYDKVCMWHAGRLIWTYSHLYADWRPEPAWLDFAAWGIAFLENTRYVANGRMFYALTRDGMPLQNPCDLATVNSTVLGLVGFAHATRNQALHDQGRALFFAQAWERLQRPGEAYQPFIATTRPVRVHGHSMIGLNVLQELRRFDDGDEFDPLIDTCARQMLELHFRPERRVLLELVGWQGEDLPGGEGRMVNPGHMIEGGIFLIHEGLRRNTSHYVAEGCRLVRFGFETGWDAEHGGIYNDVDAEGLPIGNADVYRACGKLWWQHAEALYGTMLAYAVTGDPWFLAAYEKTESYSFSHFADAEFGEWYAYLDRYGKPINLAKGTPRKNSFHIGRNFYWCCRLAGRIASGEWSVRNLVRGPLAPRTRTGNSEPNGGRLG